MTGIAIGIAGLIVTLMTEEPATVVPAMIVLLGVVAGIVIFVPRRAAVWLTGTVAGALVVSGLLVYFQPDVFRDESVITASPSPYPITPSWGPSPTAEPTAPEVTVVNPVPGTADTVPGCLYVRFEAEPPEGYKFAVANSVGDNPRLFYEGNVEFNEALDEWAAEVVLGDEDFGAGVLYRITIIMLEDEWADYLRDSRGEPDSDWWSGTSHPPGSYELASFNVRRNSNPAIECA